VDYHCLYLALFIYGYDDYHETKNKKRNQNKKDGYLKKSSIMVFSGAMLLPFNILLQIFNHIEGYVTNDYFTGNELFWCYCHLFIIF
jgi:hypothetical protein